MIQPVTFGVLAVPLPIIIYLGTEWKKARDLKKLFTPKESLFDKFKKDLIKDNYFHASYYLCATVIFYVMLIALLCYASLLPNEISSLSYIIGIVIFGCIIFLIVAIFSLQNSFLENLKDVTLANYLNDKKRLSDVNSLLEVYTKIKDDSLKRSTEDLILQYFKKIRK